MFSQAHPNLPVTSIRLRTLLDRVTVGSNADPVDSGWSIQR